MSLIFFLLINYTLLVFRLWISKNMYTSETTPHSTTRALLTGGCIACALVMFPSFLELLNLEQMTYTIESGTGLGSLLIRIGFLSILCLGIWLLFHGKRALGNLLLFMVLAAGSFLMVIGPLSHAGSLTLLYFLIVAGLEEYGKALSTTTIEGRNNLIHNSTILYAILVALGFAFMENCFYVISSLQNEGRGAVLGLTLSRGAVSFIVHGVFTGSIIGYIVTHTKTTSHIGKVITYIPGFLLGVGLHLGRNLLIHYQIDRGVILFVLISYLIASYLFFSSDSLYIHDRMDTSS